MLNHSETEAHMDGELRFWLSITKRLPHVRGAGRICGVVERIYNRKKRPDTTANVLGFKMVLDPADSMEHQFLFCPHLYDWKEIAFLRKHLKPGGTFLDAGANVGFYSLVASSLVGETGNVLCVEADPHNASRLATNLRLSNAKNARVVNLGLSDKTETLRLGLNTSGNRGGHSFLYDGPDSVTVECKTLTDVLFSERIQKVDGAKVDIEGFEFKVLDRFFRDGNSSLWPKFVIVESNPFFEKKAGGDVQLLLSQHGYHVAKVSELNYFATRV